MKLLFRIRCKEHGVLFSRASQEYGDTYVRHGKHEVHLSEALDNWETERVLEFLEKKPDLKKKNSPTPKTKPSKEGR